MGRDLKFVIQRLAQLVASLFCLLILCFGLLRFFPGSPFVQEEALDPRIVLELQRFYGLDQDLLTQFKKYFSRILQGDLGHSMHFVGRSVTSLIWEFGRTSALLGTMAFSIAVVSAFLFALASRRGNPALWDRGLLILISVPTLALGPVLIWLLCFRLSIFPVALLDTPTSYVLPILLLSFKPALSLSRVLSSSLDSTLRENYIRTTRALGFSERSILLKWALKNSMTSFLSQAGPLFAHLISGSFLIEVLFSIPGLGFHFVESVLNRDWPLILGLTLFYGTVLMTLQLGSDLVILWIHPKSQK